MILQSKVYVKTDVKEDSKLSALGSLLDQSGFWKDIEGTCKQKNQSNKTCKVVIKPNISIASQKSSFSYTDPVLVDHLVNLLDKHNYKNVSIVESENMYSVGFSEHTPDRVGKNLGYTHNIINLTNEPDQCFDTEKPKTHICLSKRMLDADYIINFPKGRNHCMYKSTGALKNMFGTIPIREKVYAFHNKESGFDVPSAVQFVYEKTPPNFTIMDFIKSIDGEDKHFSEEKLTYYKDVGILVASNDAVSVDSYLQQKMGYKPFESDITHSFKNDAKIEVIGDTLDKIPKWKKVPWKTRFEFKARLKLMSMVRKYPPAEKEMKENFRKTVFMDVIDQ